MSRRQLLTLLAAILGSGISQIDSTVVNVALPAIERDVGGGLTTQQWIPSAYLLTLGSLILIGGSLGDIFGERRVFFGGVAAFGVCSVLCAAAPTSTLLIAARGLQGVAGAMLVPSSLAVIVATFPAAQRGAAIGSWTAWGAIASFLGPILGGWIVGFTSWRWIFLINVPLVIATLALIAAAVPSTPVPPGGRRRVDVVGGALCVFGFGGVVYALIEQPRLGWGALAILGPLLAGAALLVAFIVWERRSSAPMLDLSLFGVRNFSVGNVETLLMYGGLGALFFFLVIFLQQVAGYRPLESGLATLPATAVMFALSPKFGALASRIGPRPLMGAGPIIAGGGVLLLLRTGLHTPYLTVLFPGLFVFSIGLSMTVAPLTTAVLAAAEDQNAGIASAINNAVARVASLVAISLVGLLAAGSLHGSSLSRTAGSVSAFHTVMLVCAGLLILGGICGAVGIVDPPRSGGASSHGAGSDGALSRGTEQGESESAPVPNASGA